MSVFYVIITKGGMVVGIIIVLYKEFKRVRMFSLKITQIRVNLDEKQLIKKNLNIYFVYYY